MRIITRGLGSKNKLITRGLGTKYAEAVVSGVDVDATLGGLLFIQALKTKRPQKSQTIEIIGVTAQTSIGKVSVEVGIQVSPEGVTAISSVGTVEVFAAVSAKPKAVGSSASIGQGNAFVSAGISLEIAGAHAQALVGTPIPRTGTGNVIPLFGTVATSHVSHGTLETVDRIAKDDQEIIEFLMAVNG